MNGAREGAGSQVNPRSASSLHDLGLDPRGIRAMIALVSRNAFRCSARYNLWEINSLARSFGELFPSRGCAGRFCMIATGPLLGHAVSRGRNPASEVFLF
jgi:hypothetical protein